MVWITNEKGSIDICGEVFRNIAGNAATACFGVKGMAGRSKESGIYQLLRRESMGKGVEVSYDSPTGLNISLHIVVDHGVNISALAMSIMNEVSYKVSEATGVPVGRVDVFIDSMMIG